MVCGLIAAVVLARGSVVKAIGMVVLGLLFGLAGSDINSGVRRFTFGIAGPCRRHRIRRAVDGDLRHRGSRDQSGEEASEERHRQQRRPRLAELGATSAQCMPSILRGTALGSLLGVLPGGGALLAVVRRLHAGKEGRQAIRAISATATSAASPAPESANNAGAQTSFIPMLTLGIPSNPTMALMIGALMVHGIAPGPRVMTDRPELFWGVIASMWIGNLMLVVLNLPLVGIWVRLVRVPYRLMFLAIVAFCCVGTYTINTNVTDLAVLAFFTVFGYLCLKLDASRRR